MRSVLLTACYDFMAKRKMNKMRTYNRTPATKTFTPVTITAIVIAPTLQ